MGINNKYDGMGEGREANPETVKFLNLINSLFDKYGKNSILSHIELNEIDRKVVENWRTGQQFPSPGIRNNIMSALLEFKLDSISKKIPLKAPPLAPKPETEPEDVHAPKKTPLPRLTKKTILAGQDEWLKKALKVYEEKRKMKKPSKL